jgi:hypothetical protein
MAGYPQKALDLMIALWTHHLLHVPHAILLQIATENIKIMREEYKYIAKMA